MKSISIILFIIGCIGSAASLIILVVNLLKHKSNKRNWIVLAACVLIFVVSMIVFPSDVSTAPDNSDTALPTDSVESEDETSESIETAPIVKYEYDALQSIFLALTPSTTADELRGFIDEYRLCSTESVYQGSKAVTIKIAYADDVAAQSHAETGDNIEATFSSEDGSLKHAEYFNTQAWNNDEIYQAVLYVQGTYWDFRENGMDGDYSGYYGYKHDLQNEDGIVIKYTNGISVKTDYFPYDNAEELINTIIDNSNK